MHVVIVYRVIEQIPRALVWCTTRGYKVTALVPRDRYEAAVSLVQSGDVDIIVAATRDSLDPNRVPRVEIVGEDN